MTSIPKARKVGIQSSKEKKAQGIKEVEIYEKTSLSFYKNQLNKPRNLPNFELRSTVI